MSARGGLRLGGACLLIALLASGAMPAAAQQTATSPDTGSYSAQHADSVAMGVRRGTEAARQEATSQWVFRGFLGGLTLGPIGAGAAYVAANNSQVALTPQHRMLLLQEGGAAYAAAYQDAYAEALLARRKKSALTGGALGTAGLVAVLTTVWAIYYYY